MAATSVDQPPEYQVKAVFLFNFVQFVEWPATAFPDEESPLVISVLGKDPFGNYLDETVKGEKTNGHPVIVTRYQKPEEVKPCHILFINISREDQLTKTLELLKGKHILTVSDTRTFNRRGGMIQFVTTENKVRFQINLEATKNANLVISSKLLRLAEVVTN